MAVTISIELSDAEFTTLQNALAHTDGEVGQSASDFTANVVKGKLVGFLSDKVKVYDKNRQSVSYSTFSPS